MKSTTIDLNDKALASALSCNITHARTHTLVSSLA